MSDRTKTNERTVYTWIEGSGRMRVYDVDALMAFVRSSRVLPEISATAALVGIGLSDKGMLA